ncbi:MAG TPA: hypothetical protein VFU61_06180 [Steroidobacteraceae bacterium]|nr:hypothetical protein [Steroidobacteraceae bacterium]
MILPLAPAERTADESVYVRISFTCTSATGVVVDLIISDLIRTGEKQAWFLAEHLVETPLVRA